MTASDILQKNGIKPSYHRIKILEYLIAGKHHPTVDEIYTNLVIAVPTLSKTTVYNTLNLFMKVDLVRRIAIEDNETRYDATVAEHGHFKCLQCKKIFDFPLDVESISAPELADFDIEEKKVYFQGTCPGCLGLIKNEKTGGKQ